MIVGIDSMVLVYANLVPRNAPCEEHLAQRANNLFYILGRNECVIVLPTVAIAELLTPVPAGKRGQIIATLAEQFHCPTFDQQAAAIAADLWARYKALPAEYQYDSRHVLKADAMIVATAKAAGAAEFFRHDEKCQKLADLVMKGRGLPSHREELFDKHAPISEATKPSRKKKKPASKKPAAKKGKKKTRRDK